MGTSLETSARERGRKKAGGRREDAEGDRYRKVMGSKIYSVGAPPSIAHLSWYECQYILLFLRINFSTDFYFILGTLRMATDGRGKRWGRKEIVTARACDLE